jgi:hypothetical protein
VPTRSYLGPATLVIDLREEPVTVHLEDRRVGDDRREWGGEIKTSDDLLWEALAGADRRHPAGHVAAAAQLLLSCYSAAACSARRR